jgi:outer membrane protein
MIRFPFVFWTRTLSAATALVVVAALPAASQTQGASQSRLAWVNTQLILPRVPGYAAAESTLTAEVEGYRTELQRLQDQVDSAQRDFDRQQIALSAESREAKQQSLRDMQSRFQSRWNELDTLGRQRQQELLGPLQERVRAVIEGLRAERNLAFIFDLGAPGNNILAADGGLDLTNIVIERLNSGHE